MFTLLPLYLCAASAGDSTQIVFPAERWSMCPQTNSVSVSSYGKRAGFVLPHRSLSSASNSASCQFCQHCHRCLFVRRVSLNLLYVGTESPFRVRSTSPLPEPDPSPEGFHRWEIFLGVGSWPGKKAQTEISIWICEVGSASCEHSHRRSRCFRAPDNRAANKSAGTNTSIHHSIPPSPPRIIPTLKTNCLPLLCVLFPIFTGRASVHHLISLHFKLTSCLLWWPFFGMFITVAANVKSVYFVENNQ